MPHGSADFYAAIDPVGNRIFSGVEKDGPEPQWSKIFNVSSDDEPIRSYVEYAGPAQLDLKSENAAVAEKHFKQGGIKNWTTSTYAAYASISYEAAKDLRYAELKAAFKSLGEAARDTPEYICRNFLDNAFNSSFPQFWDAKELCATDHLLPDGVTTFSNEMTSPVALSEVAQEDVMTALRTLVGTNNNRRPERIKAWVVPAALYNRAQKLSMSEKTIGSANNDPSVVKGIKVLPFDYLTSNTRYFALTHNSGGPWWKWIQKATFDTDGILLQLAKMYLAYFRAMHGCDNPRSIYGVAAS